MRGRHPGLSAAEIVEGALSQQLAQEQKISGTSGAMRSPEEIRNWLDRLASVSDRIPALPGETFGRESIYQAMHPSSVL